MNKLLTLALILLCWASNAQPIKMMTYNIRYANDNDGENVWDNRKSKVVQLINYYEPLVFGIQEGLEKQVKYLDESLDSYDYVGVGRDDGKTKGEYSAVFYNTQALEVLENSTFWLSETPDKISKGWDASLERICTYARFKNKKTGKTFWVFNTHFDHRGEEARKNSAKLILEMINKKTNLGTDKVVFMGDLNLVPEHEAIATIKSQLDDSKTTSEKAPYGPVGTSNGFKTDLVMTRRIDYIFTKNLKVKEYVQIDDRRDDNYYPSDHLPVLVELEGF
ncbi:MAG: endonuclease/exonuclease/phosphatase family protein [Cyclobacteriaceae bacterium]